MLTKNDLSQIKTVVQKAILPEIEALKQSAKKDLGNLETRVKGNMETGLKGLEKRVNVKMDGLEARVNGKMDGLEKRVSGEIKNLKTELIEKIEESEMEIIATVDKHKEDKETVKVLRERVDRLEDNAGLPPYPTQ